MLKQQGLQERRGLRLAGHRVCQRTFRCFIGLAKSRFSRLRTAALDGEQVCPLDGRSVPKEKSVLPHNSCRAEVVEFLEQLYHTVAEPLPEAGNEMLRLNLGVKSKRRGKRPRSIFKKETFEKGFAPGTKFLPPGTLGEYLEQCRSEFPSKTIGRKVFCRVSCHCFRVHF